MVKILVVDDSVSVRDVVERALTSREMEVVSAATGLEAIERIEREHPDLVVCDVLMPGRDGYEVCQFVKTHPELRRTPVLLISGTVNSTVLERAARVHSDDVLGKPFHMNELLRKVADLLGVGDEGAAARGPAAAGARPVDLRAALVQLGTLPGVGWAALADRDGFLVECAGGQGVRPEAASALASWLAASAAAMGEALGRGPLHGVSMEWADGILTAQRVGDGALLLVLLLDPAARPEVQYWVRKVLPELARGASQPC